MRPVSRTTARNQGMSLLELMVVIVIIVLIVSIGFPATSAVRQRAATAVTTSQMRNILNAFSTYASDNDDFYPGAKVDTEDGEERWLGSNGPIFRALYPQGNAGPDLYTDGQHLFQTVFISEQSLKVFRDDKDLFNHSFCLNASLITDNIGRKQSEPEFSKRNRFLYPSETQTMLIIEADGADYNSVQYDASSRIDEAMERNWNKFVLVGYMDGTVGKIRKDKVPNHTDDDDSSYFWTGVDKDSFSAYEKNEGGLDGTKAMDVYRSTSGS